MSSAWSMATTSLGRRLRSVRRYRWWALQLLVAVPGVVLAIQDTGGPDSSHLAKLWHDASLFFFVLAVTLRAWRAPEEGTADVLRFRLLHRKVAWRAFAVLLLCACLALTADRWFTWRGDPPVARDWSTAAVLLLWLAVATRLVEPLVWLLWPLELRRSVRLAKLAEDAARAAARSSRRAVAPPEIFPDQGAFGRTRATYQSHGGPPSHEPRSVAAGTADNAFSPRNRNRNRNRDPRPAAPVLHWDGRRLAWTDTRGRTHTIPVQDRPALKGSVDRRVRPVTEMVWLLHTGARTGPAGRLVLLDDKGYRFLVLHSNRRSFGPCADLAEAVGVPFAAYRIGGDAQAFRTLLDSLFPPRGRVLELRTDPHSC
ncbi:hypothetical protein [Streptacidiphilus carbonis]|uniref:hypothetical protein n=1 Tax=Streptacidiphilus carbonis TaxID=105422 RepID=UPI001269A45C|nr:hypothetical protein [Streptacidiphilus carbonis]